MFGIDWIIWGVIIAAATLGAAIGVPVVLYIRQNRANITVTSEFDKTGFVEVVLAKEGSGAAQVDSVELMAAGTNTKLPLIGRSKTGAGPINFDGGKAKIRVYFTLTSGASATDAIEVHVEHKGKSSRVKSTWTTKTISPQAGTEMIDLRDPIEPEADTTTKKAPGTAGTGTTGANLPAAQSNTPAPGLSNPQRDTDDPDVKT